MHNVVWFAAGQLPQNMVGSPIGVTNTGWLPDVTRAEPNSRRDRPPFQRMSQPFTLKLHGKKKEKGLPFSHVTDLPSGRSRLGQPRGWSTLGGGRSRRRRRRSVRSRGRTWRSQRSQVRGSPLNSCAANRNKDKAVFDGPKPGKSTEGLIG